MDFHRFFSGKQKNKFAPKFSILPPYIINEDQTNNKEDPPKKKEILKASPPFTRC